MKDDTQSMDGSIDETADDDRLATNCIFVSSLKNCLIINSESDSIEQTPQKAVSTKFFSKDDKL